MTDNTKGASLAERFKGHLYLWHEHSRHIPNRAVFKIIREIEQAAYERGRHFGIASFDSSGIWQMGFDKGFRAGIAQAAAVCRAQEKLYDTNAKKCDSQGNTAGGSFDIQGAITACQLAKKIERLTPDGGSEK